MIKLLERKDILQVLDLFQQCNTSVDLGYLNSLVDNMNEYIYLYCDNDEIKGLITCFNDGTNINIKNILVKDKTKEKEITNKLLKHLEFNANKDLLINVAIDNQDLLQILNSFDFKNINLSNGNIVLKKNFEKIIPQNISIFDYYEQNDEYKVQLLEQINEPLWPGAKHLFERVKNNADQGNLFIMYDNDRNHIITFGTLHDFDEIKNDELKPWIGSVYTFRPYRGNRFSEKLIKYILNVAKNEGNEFVYLSSDNQGMYEKFGFKLYDMMQTVKGNETQVFIYDTKKLEFKETRKK